MKVATERSLDFTLTREFIRDGVKRDHWDRCLLVYGATLVLYVLLGWYFHGTGTRWDTPWLVGTMLAGLLLISLRLWWRWRRSIRSTFESWRQQAPDGRQCFLFEDDSFVLLMQNSENRYRYADLRRLWRYPDVWLFEIDELTSVLFPVRLASEELKEFIVRRVEAAGVKVKP